MNRKKARLRRSKKARAQIRLLGVNRLCVHKTPRHIYAQIISTDNQNIVTSASTVDKELRDKIKHGGNKDAAIIVGQAIAERAKQAGVTKVAFDRSGFKYHGRIKALADTARENGIEF
ncbi:MAG: 50S ribosomal protein L18 [Gammaproteobacteria bacterium]|nr:50S ribosomal protein L18 [Gammaproteobacteria bacterium]